MSTSDFDPLLREIARAPEISPLSPTWENERYRAIRRLGEGGFGSVYEVEDRSEGGRFALKLLHRQGADSVYRFKREFRALADIAHRNLARLYELVATEERCFFTMELVEGLAFDRYVARHPSRLRSAFAQLARALTALHESGHLHRDIKPSNVLVETGGRVVVLDFGLVHPYQNQFSTAAAGTPAYMAPEQAMARPLAPASDWYAFGLMLYQAFTGRLPFSGSAQEVLEQKQTQSPEPISELAPETPPELAVLCHELLALDPADRPDGRRVLTALSPDSRALNLSGEPGPRLIGREPELAALHAAYAQVEVGQPKLVRVRGGSGIGKTALVQQFLREIESSDARGRGPVLFGRCYERESVAHKALDELIDHLTQYLRQLPNSVVEGLRPAQSHALVRLFPVFTRVDGLMPERSSECDAGAGEDLRDQAYAALRELIVGLGQLGTMVLCIDDVQWGDRDSALVLAQLLRPPEAPAALVLLVDRPELEQADSFQQTLEAHLGHAENHVATQCLELPPLDAVASARLLAQGTGPAGPALEQAILDAGGNPFFLTLIAREYHRRRAHSSLRQLLCSIIADLEEEAGRLLALVAVSGQPLPTDIARGAMACDGSGIQAALRVLVSRHLVRRTGSGLVSYHDLVRAAVLAGTPDEAQRDHHLRLAEAFALGDATRYPERLSLHFRAAGESERAAASAVAAGDAAYELLAFERATAHYRLAIELQEVVLPELFEKLAQAQAGTGRGGHAARSLLRAAEGHSGARSRQLRSDAALLLVRTEGPSEGVQLLREVLSEYGVESWPSNWLYWPKMALLYLRVAWRIDRFQLRPESEIDAKQLERADAYMTAFSCIGAFDEPQTLAFMLRYVCLALTCGEAKRVAQALGIMAWAHSMRDRRGLKRSKALLERAYEIAESSGDRKTMARMRLTDGALQFLKGRWRPAARLVEVGLAETRRSPSAGNWTELMLYSLHALDCLGQSGHLKERSRRLAEIIAQARRMGNRILERSAWARFGAEDALRRGDLPLAYAASETPPGPPLPGDGMDYFVSTARAKVLLYDGKPRSAITELAGMRRRDRRFGMLRFRILRAMTDHLEGHCLLAQAQISRQDRRRISRLARRIEGEMVDWVHLFAATLRAGLCMRTGDRPQALALLARAQRGFEAEEMRLWAAAAQYQAASLVEGPNGEAQRSAARAIFEEEGVQDPQRFSEMMMAGWAHARETE